jgi:polysaccharide export outer membrane protein
MKISTLILLLSILFSSCVSNYKYQLLQKDDVNKYDLTRDSVLRTYKIEDFNYRIQSNDLLSIKFESLTPKEFDVFYKNEPSNASNLATSIGALVSGELVDQKGEIPFPVVGNVKVAGKTIEEIQVELQEIANKYLQSPMVKVRLLNYRVTFLGEVKSEGPIQLSNNRVSIIEALGISGGFTDLADRANIKLLRQSGNKTEVIYLNCLTEDLMKSPYFYVHQNDVFIVPALKQRPFRNYFNNNLSIVLSGLTLLLVIYTTTKY